MAAVDTGILLEHIGEPGMRDSGQGIARVRANAFLKLAGETGRIAPAIGAVGALWIFRP